MSFCHPEWNAVKPKDPIGVSVILSGNESEESIPCHFVVPKARSALPNEVRGEIFAAGNGRKVVESVLPRTSSAKASRMTWERMRLAPQDFSASLRSARNDNVGEYVPYFFANAQE
jgi:hypothetical protein